MLRAAGPDVDPDTAPPSAFDAVRDATGATQSLLVLGGTSDLAMAVARALIEQRTTQVVLAARDVAAATACADDLRRHRPGTTVRVESYEALEAGAAERVIRAAATQGDIDVVLVAFGVLGEPFRLESEPEESRNLAAVNFGAAIAATQAAADHLVGQGHGSLVVLSSVAGARVRPENAVYGASKAGLDEFTRALSDALVGSGVHVMTVRPGFVHTKMTEGMSPAPFATTPDAVAADIVAGLRHRRRVVWSPGILRYVFAGLRSLPGPLWRRVAGGLPQDAGE